MAGLKYQKPRGQRLKHTGFLGVEVFDGELLWDFTEKRWRHYLEIEGWCSTLAPCRSVRAFRRMLKHNPVIRGQATLVSNYVGFNVTG